ncbi:MAG TPA: bifunctional DNA-binding transcriptional regulator/O6-methylguanine-DNA methyltransferase Ada [Blastocatellia bacterium]|nr:bifunctional DNA-binding transcriptional regulator/O6-methylguanine-DNA methyltransferase Ada [Blastocatellia bacterium]
MTTTTIDPQQTEYWQAVTSKDRRYDGVFVYGVRSTGVFCRPACPARLPRRENVEFFASTTYAVQAGFRPCRRCAPLDAARADPHVTLAQGVCRYLEENSAEPITLETLSAQFGVNAQHLQRTFKRIIGLSPRQYLDAVRLRQLKKHLRQGDSVTTAQFEAGYNSSSRLYERAATQLGMTPASYRKGGQGARIAATVVTTPLGALLIATTERGLCAVRLGDAAEALQAELRNEFPHAAIQYDDAQLQPAIAALTQYLNGSNVALNLPLDIQATAFQRRVWEALQAIPYGETRSYTDIAAAIAQPSAVRAVAGACAANPVALVIPCHRVIRGDGNLSGYRWGVERKAGLLAQESSQQ